MIFVPLQPGRGTVEDLYLDKGELTVDKMAALISMASPIGGLKTVWLYSTLREGGVLTVDDVPLYVDSFYVHTTITLTLLESITKCINIQTLYLHVSIDQALDMLFQSPINTSHIFVSCHKQGTAEKEW